MQAWSAAKQGDEERTREAWKRYRIWQIAAIIWFVVGAIIFIIIITVDTR